MEDALLIAMAVVLILMIPATIWYIILKISIFARYQKNNKIMVSDKTAKQVAEEMLERLGYTDIQVVRASYFWLWFFQDWGNRYSPRRKKILLYKNILNSSSVTAIALATQKVGLVIQHKNEEKKMKVRAKWEPWTRLAPNMLLPIVTIGLIIDFFVSYSFSSGELTNFGIVTLVFAIIAVVYTLIAFYALFLIIPTEKRAGELALNLIREQNLIPAEYIEKVEGMYATYVKKYIADFLLAILNLIYDLLRIAYLVTKVTKK